MVCGGGNDGGGKGGGVEGGLGVKAFGFGLSSGTGGFELRLSGICDGRGTVRDRSGEFSSCFTRILLAAGVLDLDLPDLERLDLLRFGVGGRLSSRTLFLSGSGVGVRLLF